MSNLDNLQKINTNIPRETNVFSADGLVIKRPTATTSQKQQIAWLAKQRMAQITSDTIVKSNKTHTYFVPRMLEISNSEYFAMEERVYGKPLTSEYFETLTDEDKQIIYIGFANFLNDTNQSYSVLTQSQLLEKTDGIKIKHFGTNMAKYIKKQAIEEIISAKQWFDNACQNDSSVVFSQGDMNEHNIFYDKYKKQVSFIDFADAKYVTAHYMFNTDLARLGWLDINRLIAEYQKLPKRQPVIIESNKIVSLMREALRDLQISANDSLMADKKPIVAIRQKILNESIERVMEIYTNATKINLAMMDKSQIR